MKNKKNVIYAKRSFVQMEIMKMNLHYTKEVRDHCHYTGKVRGAALNICNLRYIVPKAIPVVFRNGSTYDYHFIFRQLQEEFKGRFEC